MALSPNPKTKIPGGAQTSPMSLPGNRLVLHRRSDQSGSDDDVSTSSGSRRNSSNDDQVSGSVLAIFNQPGGSKISKMVHFCDFSTSSMRWKFFSRYILNLILATKKD